MDRPPRQLTPPVVARGPFNVEVIGAGYVGLVTAACLASLGHTVRCVDTNVHRISRLESGDVPFTEPGLEDLVRNGLRDGRLSFGTDAAAAARGADIAFIAVGTLDGTGRWTDQAVRAAIETLLAADDLPPLLVIRSTLRPGRMADLDAVVRASGRATTLLVHPEFTREGTAVADFLAPDRVVLGAPADCPPAVVQPVIDLYAHIAPPVLVVDHASAEMIKIGSNAFLATKITFANELARFCRAVGADMASVRRGMGLDRRIGPDFLRSGPGFGGSCLPSQVDLLSTMSHELGLEVELLPAVARSNRSAARRIATEILGEGPRPQRVAVLGLAFKALTDDLRESPALRLLEALADEGVSDLRAYDPAVRELASHPNVTVEATAYAAARGADLLLIATEWPEFRELDWRRLAKLMGRLEVYDTRSVVDTEAATKAGFRVRSLERAPRGRGSSQPERRRSVA